MEEFSDKKVMIDNRTNFPMVLVMEYLVGITTKLLGRIEVHVEKGCYYDNIVVTLIK